MIPSLSHKIVSRCGPNLDEPASNLGCSSTWSGANGVQQTLPKVLQKEKEKARCDVFPLLCLDSKRFLQHFAPKRDNFGTIWDQILNTCQISLWLALQLSFYTTVGNHFSSQNKCNFECILENATNQKIPSSARAKKYLPINTGDVYDYIYHITAQFVGLHVHGWRVSGNVDFADHVEQERLLYPRVLKNISMRHMMFVSRRTHQEIHKTEESLFSVKTEQYSLIWRYWAGFLTWVTVVSVSAPLCWTLQISSGRRWTSSKNCNVEQ